MPTMLEVISAIDEASLAITQVAVAVLMVLVARRLFRWVSKVML